MDDLSEAANFGINSSDDMLSNILEAMDSDSNQSSGSGSSSFAFHGQYYNDSLKSSTSSGFVECAEMEGRCKRQKVGEWELEPRMSHIVVERNRRKQMNHHLSVLRSLMPCFYVKRVGRHV